MKDRFGIRAQPPGLHAMPGWNGWKRRIGSWRPGAAKGREYRPKLQNPGDFNLQGFALTNKHLIIIDFLMAPECNPLHNILQLAGKRQPIGIYQLFKEQAVFSRRNGIKGDFLLIKSITQVN